MDMFLELVKKRRSVRDFSPRAVEREKIELCLEAARLAPSACNGQPWRFLVFDQPEKKSDLCRAASSGIYRTSGFISRAPVIIVALSLRGKILPDLAGRFQGKHYPLIDLGIAGEHLVLQAAEAGLGTCWVGWFNGPAVKKLLGLPKGETPIALIPLGYPAEEKSASPSRKGLEEIAAFNPD
jgi:nitroreductase